MYPRVVVDGAGVVPYQPNGGEGEGGSSRSNEPNTLLAHVGTEPVLLVMGEGGASDGVLDESTTEAEVEGNNVGLGFGGGSSLPVDEAVDEPSVKDGGEIPGEVLSVNSGTTAFFSSSSDAWHPDQSTKPALSGGPSMGEAASGQGTLVSET